MRDWQGPANGVLLAILMLLPFALGLMLSGRSRGNRLVLKWALVLAVLTIVLAAVYDVAGAVFLVLAEPTPDNPPWANPAGVPTYPTFFLPIGVGAFLAGLGILVAAVRARHRLG